MAKGKHATALFEVIHSSRRPPKSSSTGGIPTPKWWFKNRNKPEPEGSPKPVIFSAKADIAPEPPPRIIERIVERPIYIEREPAPVRIAPSPSIGMDTGDGEIRFKLSYAGAVAAGFVLVVVVAIAYLAGTRSSQLRISDDAHPAASDSTASTGIVSQSRGSGFLAAVTPSMETSLHPQISAPAAQPSAPNAGKAPEIAAAKGPETVVGGKFIRQPGLTYVIAQSYPSEEFAKKACDFLNKSGIACTVEAGPKNWAMNGWYSVIGIKSFDHIQKNPALEDYKQMIEIAGDKFTGSSRFNRFEPKNYKWRPDSDSRQ